MKVDKSKNKILILTVGLPYSGKSTWAKIQNIPIVCPDSIRVALHGQRFVTEAEELVWSIAKIMVRSLFYSGHYTVILDATNITNENRNKWRDLNWICTLKIFDETKEICINRARAVGDEEIIPIIEKMNSYAEWPEP